MFKKIVAACVIVYIFNWISYDNVIIPNYVGIGDSRKYNKLYSVVNSKLVYAH